MKGQLPPRNRSPPNSIVVSPLESLQECVEKLATPAVPKLSPMAFTSAKCVQRLSYVSGQEGRENEVVDAPIKKWLGIRAFRFQGLQKVGTEDDCSKLSRPNRLES